MNRHEISCRIVVVIAIHTDIMSICSPDKRKLNQCANCPTNSVNTCIQMQRRRLSFEQRDWNGVRVEVGAGTNYKSSPVASLAELLERKIPHGGDIVPVLSLILVLLVFEQKCAIFAVELQVGLERR